MTKSRPLISDDGEVRELTMEDLPRFKRGRPPLPEMQRKRRTTIMLDPDVLDRLRKDGKGWQTRANALLREALGL